MESFEIFHQNHPEYTFLIANIYYNLKKEALLKQKNLIVSFSHPQNYEVCDSCSS